MPHPAIANHAPETAPIPARSDNWRSESPETGNFLFIHRACEAKVQFAPHRLVGNYADYGKLGTSKNWRFGR
jgi:hypothetical protein